MTSGALPQGLTLSSTGLLAGTPISTGNFTFSAQVTDSAQATAKQQFTLTIAGGLTITTTTLPGGQPGAAYSQTVSASGGTPPYSFSVSAESLPPGLTLSSAGVLGGTPTKAGNYTFTVQVTDSASATATQQYTVAILGLKISTASTLPSAAVGTSYSETLAALGTPPYTWALTQGSLPAGLSLDTATGVISGMPSGGGNSTFTVQVTDAAQATASGSFTLAVLAASYSGLPASVTPTQQFTFTLALSSAYPAEIAGTVALTFTPDLSLAAPSDDPAIQFATGGRMATFNIPAESTAPVSFSVQPGTVAGSITFAVNWSSDGAALPVPAALTQAVPAPHAVPSIVSASATGSGSSFTVTVTGCSNTREVTQANLQFSAASGQTLQTTSLSVPLTSTAGAWYQSSTSDQYGSQFILTMPFTVSNGGANAIASVSVRLVNSHGTSNPVTAPLQ